MPTTETETNDDDPMLLGNAVKKKTVALTAFTRTYNALGKLLQAYNAPPISTLEKSLEDLNDRYLALESRCEEILALVDETDDRCAEIEAVLDEKYNLLNEARSHVSVRAASPSPQVVDSAAASAAAAQKANESTTELVKSFKASLTLPKPEFKRFNGDPGEYSRFISYIESYVEKNVDSTRQCLSFVIDSCTGVAYDAVSFLSQCKDADTAYKEAKQILKNLFGGKHQIIRSVLTECTNGPQVKANDVEGLRRIVISIRKAVITLEEYKASEEIFSTDKLVKVYHRLPKSIQTKWNDKIVKLNDKDEKPNLTHMCELIEAFIRSIDNEYYDSVSQSNVQPMSSKRSGKPVYAMDQQSSTSVNVRCLGCDGQHYINQCPEFMELSLQQRYDLVLRKQLCRNCLHKGHIASQCKRKSLCKHCKGKHNSTLHDPDFKPVTYRVEGASYSNAVLNVTERKPESVAGIACIEVLVEGRDALYKCKAIVDQKSSVNLCSERLAQKLALPTTAFKTAFSVATGNYIVEGRKIAKTTVYSGDMQNNVTVNDVLSVKRIPLSMTSVFTQEDIKGFEYLKDIHVPRVTSGDEIDLLIGSGVPKAFHQFECRKGEDNQIYAVRLTLGWDFVGPKQTVVSSPGQSMLLSCQNVFFTDHSLPVLTTNNHPSHELEQVFGKDFSDCSLFSPEVCPSIEEQKALELVKDSVVLEDQSFTVGIPWKQDPVNLPSTKEIVVRRLNGLKRRFQKDPSLLSNYSEEMNKFIQSGYVEPSSPGDTDLCHYIPHHPVWHPRKGTLRIVWDCANSLNDFIHEGPDLLNSLVDVLIRFRRFRYAITSDIRKMYLNVRLPVRDRGAFRILWWPDGDLSQEPTEYRAKVHIYGAKSSGFIANFCVQTLARMCDDPVVSSVLLKDLYVDDQASSVQDEASAVSLVKGLRDTLSAGGFHLTKFMSNSVEVMSSVPECDRVTSVDLSNPSLEHSVLGLRWEVQSDKLSFPCVVPDTVLIPTRRLLLSTIAKVYDPLGMVSPITLPIKVVLQEKSSLGWDESDATMMDAWKDFCAVLELVSDFSIPRCYKPHSSSFDSPVHFSLHGFSDASRCGYSAVVYARQVSYDGQVVVSFIMGKSRVAPKFKGNISQVTVPKLELNAAALLARLMQKVIRCIEIPLDEVYYWCDSQAVLWCFSSTDRRFPVYWSNRLAVIHGLTDVRQWRYVPTKCNPADVGSRGIQVSGYSRQMSFWVNGPSFLLLQPAMWPETTSFCDSEVSVFLTESRDVEVKTRGSELLERLVNYFSDLSKLIRVVSCLMRFMSSVLSSKFGRESILCDEDSVLLALIRHEQSVLVVSDIQRLKPFSDEKGIYRVQSRLSGMDHLSYGQKFPIILPRKSGLTRLIVWKEHQDSAHLGPNHVLAQLRRSYWVVGGKSTVRNVVSSCFKCRQENARPLQQFMSPLPEERGKPSFPFQNVGLDYFGPFMCKVRRQRVKRYGCIFVCLSTRAVHIEVVNSLESNAFLCALSRFVARRGLPEKLFSDNATNFRGSQEELLKVASFLDEVGSKFAHSKGFLWHFHPPHGSHHGGHYERLIRSVRRVLRGVTEEQEMSEDNLVTFLCEAEKILNDRPLTTVSEDPNDEVPLTPSLVLLLRGNPCCPLYESENDSRKYHRQAQYLADIFWKRWLREYVPSLQHRQKWFLVKRNLQVGDLVLMCGESYARGHWPMARVIEAVTDPDGLVRRVTIRDKNGPKVRPITKLALLEGIS